MAVGAGAVVAQHNATLLQQIAQRRRPLHLLLLWRLPPRCRLQARRLALRRMALLPWPLRLLRKVDSNGSRSCCRALLLRLLRLLLLLLFLLWLSRHSWSSAIGSLLAIEGMLAIGRRHTQAL